MSTLKDAYYDGSTGLLAKQQAAFDAGEDLVGAAAGQGSFDDIVDGLEENAALGNTAFTVTIETTYLPTALRNNKGDNMILKAFLAGVSSGLAASSIFGFECTPTLNTTDTVTTSIDLNFTF